jgi:secreted Zn-dependent insulinase-like peptidase
MNLFNLFQLRVEGYDDKLGVLLQKIVETLVSLNMSSVDAERFESFKDSYLRKLRNHENDQPKVAAQTKLSSLLRDKYWSYDDLISAAPGKNKALPLLTQPLDISKLQV